MEAIGADALALIGNTDLVRAAVPGTAGVDGPSVDGSGVDELAGVYELAGVRCFGARVARCNGSICFAGIV